MQSTEAIRFNLYELSADWHVDLDLLDKLALAFANVLALLLRPFAEEEKYLLCLPGVDLAFFGHFGVGSSK